MVRSDELVTSTIRQEIPKEARESYKTDVITPPRSHFFSMCKRY